MGKTGRLNDVVAIGGLVAALCLIVLVLYAVNREKREIPPQQTQTSGQQAKPNQARPLPSATEPSRGDRAEEKKSKSRVYKSSCGESDDHNEAELCEQRRMADAAVEQLRVNCIGLILLALTFGVTAWAAWAAAEAAKAAQAAVDSSARTADHQLRAYVNVTAGGATLAEHRVGVALLVVFKNFGMTPARDASIWVDFDIGRPNPLGELPSNPSAEATFISEVVLSPNDPFSWSVSRLLTDAQLTAIRARQSSICIWGRVDYATLGGPGFLSFEFVMNGHETNFVQDKPDVEGWAPRPRRQIVG
jgi:hypothetical protein